MHTVVPAMRQRSPLFLYRYDDEGYGPAVRGPMRGIELPRWEGGREDEGDFFLATIDVSRCDTHIRSPFKFFPFWPGRK